MTTPRDPAATLTATLGAVIHDRAHRYGLNGGGIDCLDRDLDGHHAPCYTIAAELVDHVPSVMARPATDRTEGWRAGATEVASHLLRWIAALEDLTPAQRPLWNRILNKAQRVASRVANQDPQWWMDDRF